MDSSNPFTQPSTYLDLLSSQHYEPLSPSVAVGSQWTVAPSQDEETTEERKGRKNWSQKEDLVLVSAWLNTSKDPIIGNEQKGGSFLNLCSMFFLCQLNLNSM
ncbi:unnamed protein product [Eruca vesicaria subsp. sativa]|uniref:Uncharacterized protein n=1 Tax=Eruca vesicaria subsp. sativa TaxID=29727 RepID=A0ABC8M625_ERUVS|nr:unnamed protein product [Eruca vesicaria subsp. sativa]